ncbi:type I-F CRISPR-associated endoribonuclease Cas6/Csy4 [Vibrio cholerae]|uniref:type I-F CRISPR-associated endoribonuclease Cas6/Csy4 n=1 Tax=Vibrio cholerae TaxID=666 RepID=UPI000BA9A483|nr:type I-F CRISPR-associated endoribonuclease Cas6/Csy4 [Vibrio cholerae]EGQ9610543.1 type I-F CRISPR-associated endoribonuclease Cas6/Csy4 [Vibrio cholerae]EGR2391915.1 type I-F CRISPR-associated endoribonuclease Cas6/Csy4 [Vibrio cholerae]EGR2394594.1 type I-F CRISPR-associated endoribonuclease Cas6/Csy4 [Vibrio cholerae]EJL6987282.1 type I-F CRISPR-associated endoribonuclease Cas6/Csy4 [Vibrio cholerae]EJP6367062.1 type I-F CRISPR-associated endoribonuclease Cas6/Csy4 [Vibrio cholerae]
MKRYYFSIRFLPERADYELLAGRCISTMHGFLSQERNHSFKNSVGVAFPHWNEKNIGDVTTFVSEHESVLTGLFYQPYFSTMMKEGLFDLSPIALVPEDVVDARFVYNKTIQKIFNGSKKRRIKRALERAEAQGTGYVPKPAEDREFEPFHSIPIDSHSTGQQFILHIQRQFTDNVGDENQFNSYGFASNERWTGTVPLF